MLTAHYDSVGAGPGVSDDLAGVAAIVEVARGPYAWIVRADAPAKDLAQFIGWARTPIRSSR